MTKSTYYPDSACTQPGELNALRWDDLTPIAPKPDPRLSLDLGLGVDLGLDDDVDDELDLEACTTRMNFRDGGERVCTTAARASVHAHRAW